MGVGYGQNQRLRTKKAKSGEVVDRGYCRGCVMNNKELANDISAKNKSETKDNGYSFLPYWLLICLIGGPTIGGIYGYMNWGVTSWGVFGDILGAILGVVLGLLGGLVIFLVGLI